MKKLLPLLVAFLFVFPTTALADLYTGTLEIRDGKPIMVRCDLLKHTYFLVDMNGNADVYLKTFQELGISPDTPFWGRVYGTAHGGDAADPRAPLNITVDSIENIVPGSCHMDALFK